MYYESDNYLAHYGVKGMKWGQRRAQNKAAKQAYKAEKKRISREGGNAQTRRQIRDIKANADYAYNGKSRQDMLIKQYDSAKQYNKDIAKLRVEKAAAKRDYKIAKGKNETRANKKYDRAVSRTEHNKAEADQAVLNNLYKTSPKTAKYLASKGKIKTSELNVARINAGLDVVNTLVNVNASYNSYKRR